MSWLDTLSEIRETNWQEASAAERERKSREVVTICAYASAALSVVPLSDFVLLVPVHTSMVMTVGRIYDRKLSGAEAKRVALELGAIAGVTFAGSAAINALRKLILPGLGSVVSVPATFALTWALGRAAIGYFADPGLSREALKELFEEALKEGRASFSKEAFDRFRQRNEGVNPEDLAGPSAEGPAPGDGAGASPEAPSRPPEAPASTASPGAGPDPSGARADRGRTDPIPRRRRTL